MFKAANSAATACSVPDCGRIVRSARGWCCTHYARWLATGDLGGAIRQQAPNGGGHKRRDGYVVLDFSGEKKLAHVALAESALGRRLPAGAEVHHIDEDPSNNSPENLVVCPDAAYHKLLHQRQRAFDACGHYDWRRCHICKKYDAPQNMWTSRKKAHHRACDSTRAQAYAKAKKAKETN